MPTNDHSPLKLGLNLPYWNGGMRSIDEVPTMLDALDAACRAVGRDPGTIARSVEVLVRPGDPADAAAENREIRGTPDAIAAELRRFEDLGIDELQVQLRPNSLEGVRAFGPVIQALRAGG